MKHKVYFERRSDKMDKVLGRIPPRLVYASIAVIVSVAALLAACVLYLKVDGCSIIYIIFPFL